MPPAPASGSPHTGVKYTIPPPPEIDALSPKAVKMQPNETETHYSVVRRKLRVAVAVIVVILVAVNRSEPSATQWDPSQGYLLTERVLSGRHSLPDTDLLRMPVMTFLSLLHWLESHGGLESSRYTSARERLLMFFFIVGHGQTMRKTAFEFGHSTETVNRSVFLRISSRCPRCHLMPLAGEYGSERTNLP